MATLNVSTLDVTGTAQAGAKVIARLTDATGTRIVGHTSAGALVEDVVAVTDDTGAAALDLVPRDDITPSGSYYQVVLAAGGRTDEFLIAKADSTETLLDALADDPTPVGSAALEAYAIPLTQKAAASGVAELDADALLPTSRLSAEVARAAQGRPNTPGARAWTRAAANAATTPVRVLQLGDSDAAFRSAYRSGWQALHRLLSDATPGNWEPPFYSDLEGGTGWETKPPAGVNTAVGIDGRGATLTVGDGAVGHPTTPITIPTTLRIIYDAAPAACDLEVRIDGTLVDTIDGTLDENGDPAATLTKAQVWESATVADTATWTITPTGSGSINVHAYHTPPAAGIDWHGTGQSGLSIPETLTADQFLPYLQAMVDRGEAPHVLMLAVENGDTERSLAQRDTDHRDFMADVWDIVDAADLTTFHLIYVDIGITGWTAIADQYRALALELGHVLVDLDRAIGSIVGRTDLTNDDIHLTTAKARTLADAVLIDAAVGGIAREPAALAGRVTDLEDTGATTDYVDAQTDTRVIPAGAFQATQGSPTLSGFGWALDPNSDESLVTMFEVPDGWTTYNATIIWYHLGGTAGAGVRLSTGAVTAEHGQPILTYEATGAAQVTATALAQLLTNATQTITGAAVPSNRRGIMTVARVGSNAADTLTVDAVLVGVVLTKAS